MTCDGNDVSTKDSTSCFDTLEVNLNNNELKIEHCKTLGELIRSSTSLRHFTLLQYCAETPVDIPVDMLVPIVTAIGLNTSIESVSFFPNDGLILLAALTALIRTGRSELHFRVLKLLHAEFDGKDGTLFLSKDYTHHPISQPNTTVKYLSPAKIHSLYIEHIPCRCVGDTSFLSDLYTLSKLVIKDFSFISRTCNIKCITEGFLVHCKASDEEARSLVGVEGGGGTE